MVSLGLIHHLFKYKGHNQYQQSLLIELQIIKNYI